MSLRPLLGFNPSPRRLSTPTDAYELHPDIRLYGTALKLEDPSADVAVALAIASSFVERALPADMAFFGEVGWGGELRPVAQAERRLQEAATMGFTRVLMPASGSTKDAGKRQGVEVVLCNTLAEALTASLGVEPRKSRGGGGFGGGNGGGRGGRGRGGRGGRGGGSF